MRSSELIEIAVASGLASSSNSERTYRALRERGAIVQPGRGRFASSLGVLDVAKLLVASALPLPIEQSAAIAGECASLEFTQFSASDTPENISRRLRLQSDHDRTSLPEMVEKHFGTRGGPMRALANIIELMVTGRIFAIQFDDGSYTEEDVSSSVLFYITGFENFQSPSCQIDVRVNRFLRCSIHYGDTRVPGTWEQGSEGEPGSVFLTACISFTALKRAAEAYYKVGHSEPHLPMLKGWRWKNGEVGT